MFLKRKFEKLFVNQFFKYDGSRREFIKNLKNKNGNNFFKHHYRIQQIGRNELVASANLSVGVATSNIPFSNAVYVNVSIVESDNIKSKVHIYSTLRWEHWMICFVCSLVLVLLIIAVPVMKLLFIVPSYLILWCIIHFWFQFVYVSQEEIITNKLQKALKMKKLREEPPKMYLK